METKVGIMKHFERGVKVINMAHAFGMNRLTVLQCIWHQQE
jgi:hypothetical protein